MSTKSLLRSARSAFDRAVRIVMSVALLAVYINIDVVPPAPAVASPAALTVTASVSSKPLLGGKATVHVVVKNTDTTDKAFNISVKDVLSSSRPDPQGVTTFVSASDGNGNLPPTSVTTTASTGDTTVSFINIRDLAPQESYAMDLVVDISGDATWAAGDLIQNAVSAFGNTIPNQTIPDISASTNASARVVPIVIKSKVAHQSTGVEQATGTGARKYFYTIDVQNNYVGPTQSVVVTDTIPDGIEYLGAHGASPAPTSVSRDASTGVTTLVWNLGNMATSASQQLAYDAGIRYDYFGTNNGGKNRADASALTTASAGAPIITTASAKKSFTNNVALQGSWLSNPATDSATANVTGAALTVAKSSDKGSGGLGTVINYTLTYATSQYYSAISTNTMTLVHDHLPDGQVFSTATAVPAPLSVLHNPDGSTDVTWTVGAVANTSGGTITFTAVVGTNWQEPSYAGDPIVSGDSMVNTCDISGIASDNVNPARTLIPTTSNDSVGFSTHLPSINKQMLDPTTHLWSQNVTMTVGDTSTVRVRFNTTNGSTPERSDINMGNIALTDWLPAGMSIVPGTFNVTYSSAGDFTLPTTGSPPPLNISTPASQTIGTVQGVSWYLGNVSPAGWWEATFDVHIDDVPAVQDGIIVANMWKLTGVNTFGTPYSARDMAMCDYAGPHLTLNKSVAPPSPLTGGSTVPYTLTINNTGTGPADQVSIVDTLPIGERLTAPTVTSVKLDGTTLSAGTDYVTSWSGATGTLAVNLQQGAVRTDVPGGSQVKVAYTATVDPGVAANSSLVNTATAGYSTRPTSDGRVTPGTSNPADDNTDIATIKPDGLKIAKTGPSPSTFTVGDVFGYDLDVTVPAHEVAYWPTVTDLLSHEGIVATGTPTITTQSGSPLVGASFASTATAPVRTTPVAGQTLFTFDLNDPIDNSTSNAPYVFRIHFNVQYTGLKAGNVWEFQPPAINDSFTDTGTVAWNSVASAVRQTNSSSSSGAVTTNLIQPLLKTVKTITSAGPYAGGSNIDYQIVITNPGSSRAFNPSIADTLPVSAVDATLTSLTLTGSTITSANVSSWVATPTMRVSFDPSISIGTTQTLTVKYRVTLTSSLGSGVTIANAADLNWNSLPGAPGGSRVYNDGGQENWSQDTTTTSTTAAKATISKRGPAGPVRIGDVLTYSIDATVPANTITWYPVFVDTLNMRGVSYVSNSATITTRANPPAVPATLGGSSTPTVTTSAPSNTLLTWNLPGNIDNSGNPQAYGFTLSFQVQVTGLNAGAWEYWPASNAQTISDTGSFRWRDVSAGGPATNQTANSGAVATSVKQPLITTVKTITTPGPLAGGSGIDYQVVLTNSGYNTAYDVSVVDTFPAEVNSATLATATLGGVDVLPSIVASDFSHLPTSSVTFSSATSMSVGATLTLVYHCSLATTTGAGATLLNQADANWSSLPGAIAGERVYNDAAQEGTWTADTTSVSTQTPLVTLGKRILSGLTTATIGSTVMYSLDATIPANTTAYGLTITDTVPDYLTVIAAVPSAGLPAAVVGVPTGAGTPVTEGPLDWPVAPSSSPTTLAITLLCQVRDTRYSGPQVPSGAIPNSASLQWNTRLSGGSTLSTSAGPVSFTVVQPSLTISKSASPTSAGPGDTVTFTSVLSNVGNSPAYLPSWNDVMPASMTNPVLLSVKESALPTLTAGVDFSTTAVGNTVSVAFDQPSSPAINPGETVTLKFTGAVVGGVHNGTALVDTATVNSYSSLPTTTPPARKYGSASSMATVTALSPALVTAKTILAGSGYPLPGDTVHFRYTVRNVGTAPATATVATDTLPANLSYVLGSTSASWPLGNSTADPSGGTGPTISWAPGVKLNPGDTWTINFDALVSSSAPTGTVVNTATASAVDLVGVAVPANAASWVTSDTDSLDRSTASVRIVQPGVAVAKILATGGDQFVQVGQKTGFKLTVTNTGDTTLTTVPLADTYDPAVLGYFSASVAPSSSVPPTIAWNAFGTIGPLQSKSVNVTFTVLAQPASGVATNNASVAGVKDEFNHTLPSTQDTATVFVTHPSVAVAKSLHAGQDTTIQAGQPAVFDIAVTNNGDTTLTTVPLTDTFVSANMAFATATVVPSSSTSSSLTWANLGTLAPGASTTVTVTFTAVTAPAGNSTPDTATVAAAVDLHGDTPGTVNATSSIAVTKPSVSVTKVLAAGQDPQIQVGQTVTYKLTATNTGDTALSSISLSDTWDSAALGSPSAVPAGAYAAGSANWTLAGPVAPGASRVVTLTLTALAVPSGQVTTDTATVSGTDVYSDPAPGGSSSASVRITHPAVSVAKALHAGQDPQVQVGQSVAYDLTVTNTGDTTLTTVPLSDTYDNAALGFASASLAASSVAGGVATWNNTGALAPGAARTITATFTALAVPSGQVTTDTAAVISAKDLYNDSPSDATATASVRITHPAIGVVKTRSLGQDPQIQPGQTASFDLVVTNLGDTALPTATVTDTWDPATFAFAGATAVPSASGSGSATWSVGALAPSASTTVTVTLLALASPAGLNTTDTATASGTDTYGDPAGPSTSSANVFVTHPDIAVLKTLSVGQDPQIQIGQTVRFDLRITNTGNTPLATVPIADTFDASALTFTTSTVPPTSTGAGTLDWSDTGGLGVGATRVITVTFTAASVPSGQVTSDHLASSGGTDTYGDPVPQADATGTVRITHPAVAVVKSLVTGQDPAVQAGQAVGFDLVVTNTGDTTLTTVPLTDTYDAARLAFAGAAPAASSSAAGSVHWNDVGPLGPGASTTVTANFTALSNPPGQVTTDSVAVVSATDEYGDHPADSNAAASVKVTAPSFAITKTRITDPAIQTSQTVTFDLTVTNTGDTTLTAVPLTDAWDAAHLAYFSATMPPSSLAAGFASWDVAPIAPGDSATVEVTLVAIAPVVGLTTIDHASVAGATDENGDPAIDHSASATVDVTNPQLSIAKTLVAAQDQQVQVGDSISYDIAVTNSGDTTLTTVRVADTFDSAHLGFASASVLPSSTTASSLTWDNIGALTPGQTATITVHFTATATGTAVFNDAETHGTDVNGDPAPSVSAHEETMRVTAPSVSVVKKTALGQDPEIQAGQTATFDLLVTNTGDTTLTAVPLSDTWDPSVFTFGSATVSPDTTAPAGSAAWTNVGPLGPGQQTLVTVTLLALSSPSDLVGADGAHVSATDEFGDPAAPSNSGSQILVTRPGVTVTKARHAGQDPVIQSGQTVTYDLTVTNSGNTTLTTVPLADTFDSAALSFSSATVAPDSTAPAGTLSWGNVGTLAPGDSAVVDVTFIAVAVPAGQVTTDTAKVASATDLFGDAAPDSSDSASVRVTHPAVSVVKHPIAGQDPAIQAGQPATFTITVTNSGDTTLTTVPLTDTYDGAVLQFVGSTPAVDYTAPDQLGWLDLGTLAPGQSTTVTAAFVALAAAPGQVTTDTATVVSATDQYGDHPADASDSSSVKVTRPSLSLTKSLATGQDLFIQTGQTVTFHLAVTNTGDTTLTTVPLSDGWDSTYLQFDSASVPATTAAGLASWTLGPVAPGDTATVDLTLVALGPVPTYVTTDTATVTGALDENADPANDAASSASIQVTKPSIAITKQLHDGQDTAIQVGQTVTYDIGVTNIGDITMASVPLADAFDAAVFAPASATPSYDTTGSGSVHWNNVGPLLAGETTTITVTFDAIGTSGRAASIDTATVSGATDIHNDGTPSASATSAELVTRPEVTVTKALAAGQPSTVRLGSLVSYDLKVTNSGDTTLTTVPLADTYDASQFEFVAAIAAPTTATPGAIGWDNVAPAPLGPGESVTTVVQFRTLVAGNALTNVAAVAGATDVHDDITPAASGQDSALSVYDPASLDVTKTADPVAGTILLPGQVITYTLAWHNTGGVAMPGVVVADPLPDTITYVPGSTKLGSTALTDPTDADAGQFDQATHTVHVDLGNVAADATGAVTFKAVVAPEQISAKGIVNTAVFASQGSTVATAGPVYHPVDPITIEKVGKDLNGGTLKGGDVIEWTITVANIGLTPTTHVVVKDTVPNTTTYVKGSIRGKGANDSAQPHLSWDIGTMAVGESQVVKFRSTVKKGLPTGTLIKNQAIVFSDQSNPKRSDNPKTSTNGDPTILVARTSGSEDWRLPLGAGLMLLTAGMWLLPRRRRLAAQPADRELSDQKAGDRDE